MNGKRSRRRRKRLTTCCVNVSSLKRGLFVNLILIGRREEQRPVLRVELWRRRRRWRWGWMEQRWWLLFVVPFSFSERNSKHGRLLVGIVCRQQRTNERAGGRRSEAKQKLWSYRNKGSTGCMYIYSVLCRSCAEAEAKAETEQQ